MNVRNIDQHIHKHARDSIGANYTCLQDASKGKRVSDTWYMVFSHILSPYTLWVHFVLLINYPLLYGVFDHLL